MIEDEVWVNYGHDITQVVDEKTGEVISVRSTWEATEDELKEFIEREIERHIHKEIYRSFDELLFGRMYSKPIELPSVSTYNPYADIHEKINGWLND